jgi:osmotically-inducible protein OsmY
MVVVLPLLAGCFAAAVGGAGTAVAISQDRRTLGTITEDQGIEIKTTDRINDRFPNVHTDIASYNRMVLLVGQAPDEAAKAECEKIARSIENVRGVYNEMTVAGSASASTRTNDAYITSKVKARFVDQHKFNVLYIKVVTETGAVYLLGLVTHQEANDAVEIARTTDGVQKVVKLFEYLD